jgi:hypothetical protein
LGYVPGSIAFIAKVGSLVSVGTSVLSIAAGSHLGSGLAALGILSAPAWAVPAGVVGGALVVAGAGVVTWQYRDEIATAVNTVRRKVTGVAVAGVDAAVKFGRGASKCAKAWIGRTLHRWASHFPIDPTESPS